MKSKARSVFSVCLALIVWQRSVHGTGDTDEMLNSKNRRPVAFVLVNQGRQLVTANHRSGSLTQIDLQSQKVTNETTIGKQLSDMTAIFDSQLLLSTDEEANELVAIRFSSDGFRIEKRLNVSPYPVSVKVNRQGTRAYVTSLWSRMLTVVDLEAWTSENDRDSAVILRQIRLPFAPRIQLVVDPSDQQRLIPTKPQTSLRLVVADAFGSKVAVVDPDSGQIDSVRIIPGHSIRAMRLHPTRPRLFLTHQMLSRSAQTTFDDVHWGNLMVNCLRSLDLADVLDPKADLLKKSSLDFLGRPEQGAGDPWGFDFKPNGSVVVAISGTDELIDDDGTHLYPRRLKVGNGPTAVATGVAGDRVFVVNSLEDSITIVKLNSLTAVATISLGPRPEESAADRGERLFRSARLSHDNWISCSSCHVDGHSNGLFNDNQTDGTIGTAKRVLSLRGVADTAPYAWNGRFQTLAQQIKHSVQSTMHGDPLSDEQMSDLEEYLRTLPPPPAAGMHDKAAADRGESLFKELDCRRCHVPPTFTSAQIVDVKLKDERGNSEFNPPSLRGVCQNGPYFHDGRAESLEAVFQKFGHQLDRELTSEQITDLIAYLNSL